MSLPTTTRIIVNANPPIGALKPDTFAVEIRDLAPLQDGQVLIKTLAFGNEPAVRAWIDGAQDPKRGYAPPILAGDIVRSPLVGEVAASRSDRWAVGAKAFVWAGWEEYTIVDEDSWAIYRNPELPGHSPWLSLGALGTPGRTAWVGAFKECNLKPEHTVLVSGAAGATGLVFVQIAKHVIGCKRVVGIAGGRDKCAWVKSIGADECLDYKHPDFAQHLNDALPDYCDIYFDNVGGEILNQALTVVKKHGLVVCCGSISGYNGESAVLSNWFEVIANRLTIRGFVHSDHMSEFMQMTQELAGWVAQGKIQLGENSETVVDAKFEDASKVWQRLFTGEKKGKLVTRLV